MGVELVVPRKIAAGAPVPIAIRIVKTADRPVELHLLGRATAFDLIVGRGDVTVWRRLEGQTVQAILQPRVLAPGEVLELQDTWLPRDQGGAAVGPGEYPVSGSVPTPRGADQGGTGGADDRGVIPSQQGPATSQLLPGFARDLPPRERCYRC